MGEFFGSLYCTFPYGFFGIELANYLWGISSPYSTGNSFIGIGLWMLGISLTIAIIFYYVIDHTKLNNWWGWGIFLVVNAIINFLVGWQSVLKDYYEGLMVNSADAPLGISESEILRFGVTNMLLSVYAFIIFSLIIIIFSLIIKWWSKGCATMKFNIKRK